jgi:tetratricopeptide (TPR) repeat protein
MRSGRVEEGTPYLFKGAREAMLRGAVHEAELGLTTATRNLSEPARSEAYLLLAEVLQEQERLEESLEALRRCAICGDEGVSDHIKVLTCSAGVLQPTLTAERKVQAESLLELLHGSLASRTRLRGAVSAARAIAGLRSSELAIELLHVLNGFQQELNPEELATFLLAKAMALYVIRDNKASIDCIAMAAESLAAVGAANSVIASLECGLGANYCAKGLYTDAIPHFVSAFDISSRLGNYHFACQASVNAALCYGRLGDYGMEAFWSARGEPYAPGSAEADRMLMEYTMAHANAMRGLTREALNGIQSRTTPDSEWPWLRQARYLRRADIYFLVGKENEALKEAALGTVQEGMVLHSDSFAGPFARWTARIAVAQQDRGDLRAVVSALVSKVANLDAIDQVEVLAARVYLGSKLDLEWRSYYEEMRVRLRDLPEAVEVQLGRLGALLDVEGPELQEVTSRLQGEKHLSRNPRSPRSTPAPTHAT